MSYWLLKSEPAVYSLDDLARDKSADWDGVRNYQARNNLRTMRTGDLALFYHSNAEPSAAVGVCRIAGEARPDPTQFRRGAPGYDPKSEPQDPRWSQVRVEFVERFARAVTLGELRRAPALAGMERLRRSRLSVSSVSPAEWNTVVAMGRGKP